MMFDRPLNRSKKEDLAPTILIQRLKRPHGTANIFAFGGGLKNGGLTAEAMDLLKGIFSFDYMGAAEFEFGAVPHALQQMGKDAADGLLLGWEHRFPADKVSTEYRDVEAEPDTEVSVFILARETDADEIESRIVEWASRSYNHRLKEPTLLNRALLPTDDRDASYRGWLELDNGFAFFVDREMWAKTCELFGVKV